MSWPRDRTIVREIELPGSNIKELKESLPYQLDSFILFPEDVVYYDIHPSNSAEYGEKVFIFAIKKEDKAHRIYTQLAQSTEQKEFKELFTQLAHEEAEHRFGLEFEYDLVSF